jgi:hypothetical protein
MSLKSRGIARIAVCTLAFGIATSSFGAKAPPPASVRDAPAAAAATSLPRADALIRVAVDSLDMASDPESRPSPGAPHQPGRVIPDTPLSFPRLKGADILADLWIGELRVRRDVSVRAVSARISLGESRLRIDPVAFASGRGGGFSGTLEVSALADNRYRIASRIETTGVDADTVIALLGASPVGSGAKTDAKLTLRGEGATLRSLAATLNGDVRIVVGPGRFPSGALDLGDDTLVRVLDTINPFHKREKETRLECAALRFPVRDGVAVIENGLGFETDRISVIATGAVNLRDETLDLAFHPQLREGLGISLQTTLAEMVRVQGTLTHPVIGMDAAGSARTALNIGAAVLTAGGTLVASTLFDRAMAARACDAALGKVQASRPSATGMITDTAKRPIRILDKVFGK